MLPQGIYEELVTQLVNAKLSSIDKDAFQFKFSEIDKQEAARTLSKHIASTFQTALGLVKGEDSVEQQIAIANKMILFLKETLKDEDFNDNLIDTEGKILKAVFAKTDAHFQDLDLHLKEITPYTRLSQSELFTGGNSGLSLESELRKEILSSDRIDLLVSFIKFKGIIILERELNEFVKRGGQLRVITTTYMGASDYKAIKLLADLPNTEVKISYNTGNERLHAKAYLFHRNTGFHTGYIGSSNFSRSALTDGLEWNLKITTKEVSHIIDKFQKTFESYWQNGEFETFDSTTSTHTEKLKDALQQGKTGTNTNRFLAFFDLKPHHYQIEILEKLEVERKVHTHFKNLIVAATGTGKTIISAFDFKRFIGANPQAKLLFIAHRKEILEQACDTFRAVLKDNNFGELWVEGNVSGNNEHVFASVQTLKNRIEDLDLTARYYDYIVIDEVHHISASSYRPILNYFTPQILLGLTATPERMDGADILDDFDGRIAAEIRLPEALNNKLLCPFQYFGISDNTDLSNVQWERGRYVASELSDIYTSNDHRVGDIISSLNKYTKDIDDVRALGFCITIEHAKFMAAKFVSAGLKAGYLASTNSSDREILRLQLRNKEINYLFVVDIFNEGVDIPEIDTVLFLRPTESLTIFLQQLGRGLRLADDKDALTVLDFVANSRPEYDFEGKFRALIGKTNTSVEKELSDNFPHLPLGCSIVLEKKAKESILRNIHLATSFNKPQLVQKIRNYKFQSTLPLTLKNFIQITHIPIQLIYKKGGWNQLCALARERKDYDNLNEFEIVRAIENKWLTSNSSSYFQFILQLARKGFNFKTATASEEERKMALMLHYDIWYKEGGFIDLDESIQKIGKNQVLVTEIIEVLEFLLDKVDFMELPLNLPFKHPIRIHARYSRDQIFAAFGLSTFEKKSSNYEGVARDEATNTEILFVDLVKSEQDFSTTTMYDDYSISEILFHWQSQNSARGDKGAGLNYVIHRQLKKNIILFVREKAKNEFGTRIGYVCIGLVNYQSHYGSKPMSINWKLEEPMPSFLWKDSAKLSVG